MVECPAVQVNTSAIEVSIVIAADDVTALAAVYLGASLSCVTPSSKRD